MRLRDVERTAIGEVIAKHLPKGSEVFLYGSRTDDNKRGGDIDLVVVSEQAPPTLGTKLDILIDLKERIGEQRIDLSIVTPETAREDPFWRIVMPGAVRLAQV